MSYVLGIGQCAYDYLIVVDGFPEPDTKKEVSEWVEQGGGPVATALVTLSRFGIPCRFYGLVGDDEEGEKIKASLLSEGMDVGGVKVREGSGSQVAIIIIEKSSGRRTIFWRRPTGRELLPEEIREEDISESAFLHLDGLMAEASLYAARVAKGNNVPVMVDAGRVRPGIFELAGLSDYFVSSEEFALEAGWDGSQGDILKLSKKLGAPVFTVTLGTRGSITCYRDKIIKVPAIEVNAVDTTGAGDVFHGAYIYGVLQGWELEKILRFATIVAGLKCRKIGGRAGIPSLQEALGYLT